MFLLALIPSPVLIIYALWIFFLAVMSLRRAKEEGTLKHIAYVAALPILVIGYLLDFISNLIVSALLLEIPKETTVTAHFTRLVRGPDGRRKSIALFICRNFLDYFDPSGRHCG